jgi:diguanylate cyclase (GGDEF)-like protein
MEKRCIRADRSIIWVLLSVSLMRDGDGEPTHYIAQLQDIGDRKRYERDLRALAERDPLTGLPNRRALSAAIGTQLAQLARYGGALAVLMVDLDRFKSINDTAGHDVGDAAIRATADALRDRLRDHDTVARLGGDEFVLVLPHTDTNAACGVADGLVALIAGLRIDSLGGRLALGASIGVVVAHQADHYDERGLLAAADRALYVAKDAGRGQFAVFDPDGAEPLLVARD